jgi:heat shock protein HslJ
VTQLADTEWTVISYGDGSGGFAGVLAGTNLTLAFSADGRVSGSGGCNGYAGSYALAPPAITIGPVAATRRFCASPEGVMAQESAFFAALTTAASFTSDGATLQLWTPDGGTAVELAARRPG